MFRLQLERIGRAGEGDTSERGVLAGDALVMSVVLAYRLVHNLTRTSGQTSSHTF